MGTPTAAQPANCSAWGVDRNAAVVGGGPGIWILCAQGAVRNYLRRAGRGDRINDLDGALHRDYFLGRSLERGARGKPEKRAGDRVTKLCASSAIPGTQATSVR